MTLREQLEQRRRQWEAFHRWEAEDPDPEKLGIQAMRRALANLQGPR
jgi:hypothetical protein